MPIVGIVKRSVISLANRAAFPPKRWKTPPASSTASASRSTLFRVDPFPALNLIATELMHDCGVNPTWPITGIRLTIAVDRTRAP